LVAKRNGKIMRYCNKYIVQLGDTGCRIQVTSYRLQVAWERLYFGGFSRNGRVAGYKLQVAWG